MTLFRKVFQDEARPATASEALDEEALRAALQETPGGGTPFVLDPFEHAVSESDTSHEPVDAEMREEMENTDNAQRDEVGTGEPTEDARETDDVTAHPESPDEVDAVDEPYLETPDANLVADTDEQIAAFMMRAFKPEQQDSAEPFDQDAEMTQSEQDEADDESTMYQSLEHAEVANASEASGSFNPSEPDSVAEGTSEEPDLRAFAMRQMSVLAPEPDAEDAPVSEADPSVQERDDGTSSDAEDFVAVPRPATGRSGRSAGRVKTRLLGFNRDADAEADPFDQSSANTATAQREKFPVGWLVIVEGPGEGHAFSIFNGASVIGRGEDQMIRLDFGDNTISRNNHAAIAYDEESNKFYIGHGGKSNIIRRNARPVLSTEELNHADLLRIGETTLKFVALCGPDFQWNGPGGSDATGL